MDFSLPLPIRASGLCAEFFSACGFTVTTGVRIVPEKVIGHKLNVRFGKENETASYKPISFEKHIKELPNESV